MNPLKERRTVTTTKTIATLFTGTALLVAFMGMSLSAPQAASASRGPPCPEGTVDFQKGDCIGPEPTLVRGCEDPNQQITGPENKPDQQKCTGGGPPNPVVLIPTCSAPFQLDNGQCVAKPGNRVGQQT